MPKYAKSIEIPNHSAKQLFDRISTEIDQFLEKTQLPSYELKRNPDSTSFDVKSSYFSATLKCLDGQLKLDGSLSLIALPFRSKLDDGIDRWIAKTFPA